MTDRVLRRIERLLDEADEAVSAANWPIVRRNAQTVLSLDPENLDARAFLRAADRATGVRGLIRESAGLTQVTLPRPGLLPPLIQPITFDNGRYHVKVLLGEGSKKRVYLATDTHLQRDVAFELIKARGLDEDGRRSLRWEAERLLSLSLHPHIVAIYDMGEEHGQPYINTELKNGGDLRGLLAHSPQRQIPLERALRIAIDICAGLEFVHSKGIVHQDLRPSAIWLTASGAARISDFGLDIASGRSGLLRAGVLTSTVSYLPPEQATGAWISPRTDLYSLGALLYELLTGRAPFYEESAIDVLTQHLHRPAVAPSWHRPELTAALDALVLQLLEKDPARRPASAAEVRESLARLLRERTKHPAAPLMEAEAAPQPPSGANPLYQSAFVGRDQELKVLQAAFDDTVVGKGSLAVVVGEPGIGKTALCERLATYAVIRGGKALVGQCFEESALSAPFRPFVEAIRAYVVGGDPTQLAVDLGPGAAEIARLVGEVHTQVQVEDRPPSTDADEGRTALYEAVAEFLRNASARQPLLVVLEDLQWADSGTLDLLGYLNRKLTGGRILVVGTYRDAEIDRSPHWSGPGGDLLLSDTVRRVSLPVLTAHEVHRVLENILGQEVSWHQADLLHRRTEGNPLFVQELLRFLVEDGVVPMHAGPQPLPPLHEGFLPRTLREVIGKRLGRLSDETNQVLSIASIMGREFRQDAVQQVSEFSGARVLAALEEAGARGLVEPLPARGNGSYRFTHALFCQTLYDEIFPLRRLRLHLQMGKVLEDLYARHAAEYAPELAAHFAHGTAQGDLAKALRYSEAAAEQAKQVAAFGEAVHQLERALQIDEVLDSPDPMKRCDLLLRQLEAMLPLEGGEPLASKVAEEAYALAEGLQDRKQAAHAAVLAVESLYRVSEQLGAESPATQSELERWLARADQTALPGTADREFVDLALDVPHQNSRKDAAIEQLIAARCVLGSDGRLKVSMPFIDRDRVDLEFSLADQALALGVQVHVRFKSTTPSTGLIQAGVRRATFRPSPDLAMLFVLYDDEQAQDIERVWLIPSESFATVTRKQMHASILMFAVPVGGNSGMWSEYLHAPAALSSAIETLLDTLS